MVVSDDYSPVRVAENDLGTHLYKFVHEEKSAFEHFLMYQHTSFALCGNYQHDTEKVWSESRPWCICNGHYGAVHERINGIAFLGRDENVVTALLQMYSQSPETLRNDAEVLPGHILDGYRTSCQCCHADETADLDHVRKNLVGRSMEDVNTCNR